MDLEKANAELATARDDAAATSLKVFRALAFFTFITTFSY